jgi:uracil-DNA glycosylase
MSGPAAGPALPGFAAACPGGSAVALHARLDAPLQAHFAALVPAWKAALGGWLVSPACAELARYVDARRATGAGIFPPQPLAALQDCTPREVRVVVLGQDPYHGPGQAHGYAFSVLPGVPLPPSLRNIFQELARDLGDGSKVPRSGSLLPWSRQGVLLLNTVLTVEQGAPGSHAGRGWEACTDALIDHLACDPAPRVFLLWGAHAQAKRARIEAAGVGLPVAMRPRVLVANHPSPLSARRPPLPFIGCGHFSAVNRHLAACGLAPINW